MLVNAQDYVNYVNCDRNKQDAVQAAHEELVEIVLLRAHALCEAVAGTEEKEGHQKITDRNEQFQTRTAD